MGSFFYGNIAGQIPGGMLAERFGGKWIFLLGIMFSSIVTILTPLGASMGIEAFITLRALQGLGHVSKQNVNSTISDINRHSSGSDIPCNVSAGSQMDTTK